MIQKKINKRILVLCEGFTEYLYAKALKMELPRSLQRAVSVEIEFGKQNDPKSLARQAGKKMKTAKKERNPYDAVWIFFDNDNNPRLREAFDIIAKNNLHEAYSSICIEHWFILHFEECGRAFQNGEEALRYLQKFWPQYHKTKSNAFQELRNNLDLAIKRSQKLAQNPASGVAAYTRNPYFTIGNLISFFNNLKKNPA